MPCFPLNTLLALLFLVSPSVVTLTGIPLSAQTATPPEIQIVKGLPIKPEAKADRPDYSREAVVIEKLSTIFTCAAEGTCQRDHSFVARVQSDAGVREFGVLSFA